MTGKQLEFDQRVQKLNKKHAKINRGYRVVVRKDGLVVMKPQRLQSAVPVKALAVSFLALFAFKTILLTGLGDTAYEYRLGKLAEGTPVEQAGAFVMKIDPISSFLSTQLGNVIR